MKYLILVFFLYAPMSFAVEGVAMEQDTPEVGYVNTFLESRRTDKLECNSGSNNFDTYWNTVTRSCQTPLKAAIAKLTRIVPTYDKAGESGNASGFTNTPLWGTTGAYYKCHESIPIAICHSGLMLRENPEVRSNWATIYNPSLDYYSVVLGGFTND